eukprot:748791-Hanusia_phi.AAC.1
MVEGSTRQPGDRKIKGDQTLLQLAQTRNQFLTSEPTARTVTVTCHGDWHTRPPTVPPVHVTTLGIHGTDTRSLAQNVTVSSELLVYIMNWLDLASSSTEDSWRKNYRDDR